MSGDREYQGTPFRIVDLDEIDSTNLEALRRASAGERGPVWISARRQLAGRGRSGRTWVSGDGNLAATLLFAPGCPIALLHQLSLLTGVAVFDAVTALVPGHAAAGDLRLKWPNDILLGGAKAGGILIESTTVGSAVVAAIGIGVNIWEAPAIEGREAAAIGGPGKELQPRDLLACLDHHLRRWLDVWDKGARFDLVRQEWLGRCGPIGQRIEVNTGAERTSGAFAGIDETGALLVDSVPPTSGTPRRFTFGDVSLLSRTFEGSS